MAKSLQDVLDQRAATWDKMKAFNDAHPEFSGEDETAYRSMEADFDADTATIERMQRDEARDASLRAVDRSPLRTPAGGKPVSEDEAQAREAQYEADYRSFLTQGLSALDTETRQRLGARMTDDKEMRAAGVATGAAGGFTVPLAFRDKFVQTLKWYGPMFQVAEVIDTESGVNLPWPTNDDTGNVGAILAENTAMTEQDVTLGTNSLDAFMYTSKLVRVSYQLLQDRPDFDTWLATRLGERVGRILNQHFTTGTGTAQPDGFVTNATVGATGAGSFATVGGFSDTSLIDLVESLDPAYGASSGLTWMMHQSARRQIRKFKDTTGAYMFQPSIQNGTPDQLLGYPMRLNNDMAPLAQNSKSVAFGDFKEAYVIRNVKGLTTMRLSERYAEFLQVGFSAYQRADGTLQNANAVKILQSTPTA